MPIEKNPSGDEEDARLRARMSQVAQEISASARLSHGLRTGSLRAEYNSALNIRAEIINDQHHAQNFPTISNRLTVRHNRHLIGPEFITVVLGLIKNPADPEMLAKLKLLRKKANDSGFFLMDYSQEQMMKRLTSPQYVISESYGNHPDPNHSFHAIEVPAADCQCWLPDASDTPAETVQLPGATDVVYESDLVALMRNKPWAFGEVKDINTIAQMMNLKLAGAARNAAFEHIKNVVNPTRGAFLVTHMAASIAQMNGIVLPDGTQYRLSQAGQPTGVKNNRSIIIHQEGRYAAPVAYTIANDPVPVMFENEEYKILTDWFVHIHSLYPHQ